MRQKRVFSFNHLSLFSAPTSLSSLASLSLSSSMVISSRGWGAKGVGHGGGRGRCKGGDRERLISCSRKAEQQIKEVRKGQSKTTWVKIKFVAQQVNTYKRFSPVPHIVWPHQQTSSGRRSHLDLTESRKQGVGGEEWELLMFTWFQ